MAAPTQKAGAWLAGWDKAARVSLCLLGVVFSLLALHVPYDADGGTAGLAGCRSTEGECRAAAETRWRRGCGLVELLLGDTHFLSLPNSLLGLLYYFIQLLLGLTSSATAAVLLIVTAIVSALGSLYLAAALLSSGGLSAVCGAVYTVNFLLLGLDYRRLVFLNAAWTGQQQAAAGQHGGQTELEDKKSL